jgi:hypothetical protein
MDLVDNAELLSIEIFDPLAAKIGQTHHKAPRCGSHLPAAMSLR